MRCSTDVANCPWMAKALARRDTEFVDHLWCLIQYEWEHPQAYGPASEAKADVLGVTPHGLPGCIKYELQMRPEWPAAAAVDNPAPIQPARSRYISWVKLFRPAQPLLQLRPNQVATFYLVESGYQSISTNQSPFSARLKSISLCWLILKNQVNCSIQKPHCHRHLTRTIHHKIINY